jgi:hypothetical protein
VDILALKVAARFSRITPDQIEVRDEGDFRMRYIPRHEAVVEPIAEKMHKAFGMYQAAGIPVRHKLDVVLHGSGAAHADALYSKGLIQVAPKAYNDVNLVKTLIHELGHYTHDMVVKGGYGNWEVMRRYRWALSQEATGTGPRLDVIRKRVRVIDALLRQLEEQKYVLKPMPKKGEVFDYNHWSMGVQLPFKVRIVKKAGPNVTLEIMNPEVIPFNQSGYFPKRHPMHGGGVTLTLPVKSLLFKGLDPKVESQIADLNKERDDLWAEMSALARTEKDDRYEAQRHEWAPTQYSRKNVMEWFAELCTVYVLGHMKHPVDEWLLSVIKTGEAPPGMELS